MQLYDLSEEKDRKQNKSGQRKTREVSGRSQKRTSNSGSDHGTDRRGGTGTEVGQTSGKRKKSANRELQMIGASTPVQKHRKIRADVVTKLDIIGEDVFEEDRQLRLERQRRARRRRLEEEEAEWERRHRRERNHRNYDREEDDADYEYGRGNGKRSSFGKLIIITSIVIMLILCVILVRKIWNLQRTQEAVTKVEDLFTPRKKVVRPDIVEDYLDINEYSRPGEALGRVNNIFVHYTANPGTTAKQNRNYFEGLAESGETSASAHFVIGYDGEIIQCIPLQEVGYAVVEHNYDSVSIECCYLDEDGHFTDATYQSLLHLTTWLMGQYHLTADDVLRHYDASGKLCPKYYVENENAWTAFKADLENYIEAKGD
ncbi:MAG: peptidoglycan recognition family protein [Lachnospiraceae bacterium]|nr:peptidoglycan recognition family protein [Lachnospiraceae bacterium]